MPPAVLSRDDVVARLMTVVRRQGYDGASLAELSAATGLGRSSLYHHFPDGKDDMVAAVLESLHGELEVTLFAPLRAPGPAMPRLKAMGAALDAFYQHGRAHCLLASLGIGDASKRFHPRVKRIFRDWIRAIACALRDGGLSKAVARTRAEEALVRIEGALVLARSLDDASIFARTLRGLPAALLGAP